MAAPSLVGQRFGRLTVLARTAGPYVATWWACRCDCGTLKDVAGSSLRSGDTRSCGCYRDEVSGARLRGHGLSGHELYPTWCHIVQRCTNPNNPQYRNYGGRGIEMCARWRHSFPHFLADMGERPDGCQVDRVDVDGNYEPGNCRWLPAEQQSANRRPPSEWRDRKKVAALEARIAELEAQVVALGGML